MRQRLAFIQHPRINTHRGALSVIEKSLHKVTGRSEIFQPLLVLDADRIAAKLVREPQRRGSIIGPGAGVAASDGW